MPERSELHSIDEVVEMLNDLQAFCPIVGITCEHGHLPFIESEPAIATTTITIAYRNDASNVEARPEDRLATDEEIAYIEAKQDRLLRDFYRKKAEAEARYLVQSLEGEKNG